MNKTHGYAPVNGLKMYYEIEGDGDPLVFIRRHLAVAGVNAAPALARTHRVITFDLQGHGRTADLPERPMSLQQNAKDVIGLLRHLGVSKADLLGESYGGATAILIALYSPDLVHRVATYGATFGPAEEAHNLEMLRFDQPPTPDSECFQFQRESYEKVAPDPDYWPKFWNKGGSIRWDGFSDEELASLKAPILIALGDHDFVRVEHAVKAFRRIPTAELAVIPDAGHFALDSEPDRVLPIVDQFLTKPAARPPIASAGLGYRPGETR
jgi:pimeloyl-ACP methyl ester carboxylesterase